MNRHFRPDETSKHGLTRRAFIGKCAKAATGSVVSFILTSCGPKRLYELPPERLQEALRRMEQEYRSEYGVDLRVKGTRARPGVVFGYALDLSRCIGCRRCVYACAQENNCSRDPQIHWIRVLRISKDKGISFEDADPYYDRKKVPIEGYFTVPVACQQCRNPPCTKVCPVQATWQEPDGIVVVDYEWCIGCRCCMAACPYGARHFNWAKPSIPRDQINTDTHFLGNRPRPKGVAEKCTFCIQRTREGRYPACVEVCPVGARKFGNLLDPSSEIRYILKHKRVLVLKEELNTVPKFFYFFGV